MRKTLLLFILLPLGLIAQPLTVSSPVRYLALGDSYTIGESVPAADNWPNQLKDSLEVRNIVTDTLRIIATTGWRTDDLISAITNQGLDSGHFNLVSLLIGVNNQYQGRPFSQYVTEFPQLVDSAIRYAGGDTSHVFIVSIPDYAYTPFGIQTGDTAQISMQLDTYNLVAKQFADSFHIRYFNITPISRMDLANPALVAGDGLHPSALQYSMWIKLMLQTIDSANISTTTGINNIEKEKQVSVYPNPAHDELTITNINGNASVQIENIMSQIVLQRSIENPHIDISSLPVGLYTVKVLKPDGEVLRKVVKE